VKSFWGRQRKRLGLDKLVEEHRMAKDGGCDPEAVAALLAMDSGEFRFSSGKRAAEETLEASRPKIRVLVSGRSHRVTRL
jgi:hypothetical protein